MIIKDENLKKVLEKRKKRGCKYCGSFEKLTIDHKIPKQLGGQDTKKNLQILCERCNSFKSGIPHNKIVKIITKWETEWKGKTKFLRKLLNNK